MTVLPTLAALLVNLSPAASAPQVISLSGDRWRMDIRGDRGTFDFLVQPKDEPALVSIMRPGGEPAWYGYNEPAGERQTSQIKPSAFARQGETGPVTVRCVLDQDLGIAHEALYYPIPEGVLVVSRLTAQSLPRDASIIRVAPKMDVNTDLLTHYAFVGPDGREHTGAVASLGPRDTYAGAGAWAPGGDQVAGLSPEYPYTLLFNPDKAVSLGVVLPLYQSTWRNAHSFLQLWHGGFNFWYAGFLPSDALRSEHMFVLYALQSGTPEALRNDAARVCREVSELVAQGKVQAPALAEMLAARGRFERDWPGVRQKALAAGPTRSAWLAIQMLRSARDCLDRDPVAASQLVDRATAALQREE
jgi:hypothetical protein